MVSNTYSYAHTLTHTYTHHAHAVCLNNPHSGAGVGHPPLWTAADFGPVRHHACPCAAPEASTSTGNSSRNRRCRSSPLSPLLPPSSHTTHLSVATQYTPRTTHPSVITHHTPKRPHNQRTAAPRTTHLRVTTHHSISLAVCHITAPLT